MRNPCWRRGARAKDLVAILKLKEAKVVFARALLLQQGAAHPIKQCKLLAICEFTDDEEACAFYRRKERESARVSLNFPSIGLLGVDKN